MRAQLRWLCLALAAVAALALSGGSPAAGHSGDVAYLDNGTIRLGVDLDNGGTVVSLTRSRSPAGDVVHGLAPVYAGNGWQAVVAGGDVLASANDGRTLYTKVLPGGRRGTCTSGACPGDARPRARASSATSGRGGR
jgi:hypothetical protein